jgi:hypothetical protein
MLAPVDGDGPLFGDAGADAVGALNRLRPHAAEPGSPEAKTARIAIITAVLDRYAGIVAEEKGVAGLANYVVEPINLLLRTEHQPIERLATFLDLSRGQNPWRLAAVGIDVILAGRSLPGGRNLVNYGVCRLALRNQIDLIGMLRPTTASH